MNLSDIRLTDKGVDILNDDAQVLFAEGVTNSGKSFILGMTFFDRILEAPRHHDQFVLAGTSLPVLEKMYIQNPTSFYNINKPICKYSNSGTGGARIIIQTPTGEKMVYLVGYDNKAQWKKILGLTVFGFNVEEINIADDDFISELFIRVFRNGGFLICSSNGGDPDARVYTDYLNKCRPLDKWSNQIPKETWEELNRCEANDNYRYYFFNFDDNPTMTEQQKTDLFASTPNGSYQWMTKILGIRGIREGVIYAEYMRRDKNIIPYHSLFTQDSKYEVSELTIGIDVGGTDHTVITLNGFTRNYKEHIVIDYMKINNVNHDMIWDAFVKWFTPYYEKYSMIMQGAFIDNAAKIMRLTFDARMKQHFHLRCHGAKKYTIKQRVDWGMAFLDQGRLLFTDRTDDIYVAFTKAFYNNTSKTDIRDFNQHIHKDMVDSVEYGQAPYTNHMSAYKGG